MKTETWVVLVREGIAGPVLVSARRGHGRRVWGRDIPAHVREHFSDHVGVFPWETLNSIAPGGNVLRVTREAGAFSGIYFTTNIPAPRKRKLRKRKLRRPNPGDICNIYDLAAHVGADTPERIARRLFKDTACGVSFWATGSGAVVTGYAEGSDAELPSHSLEYPFSPEEWDSAVAEADYEGCEEWDRAKQRYGGLTCRFP